MKTASCLVAIAAMLVGALPAQGGKALDGKQIFLAQKCNMCHSVPTAGISRTTRSTAVRGPDLVNLTSDAPTLTKWLRRQLQRNAKLHPKAFTGSDEELGALIAWLQKQKK